MATLVFINPSSFEDPASVEETLLNNKIIGKNFTMLIPKYLKRDASVIADHLSYSTKMINQERYNEESSLPVEQIYALINPRVDVLINHAKTGERLIAIESSSILARFSTNFLQIDGVYEDWTVKIFELHGNKWEEAQLFTLFSPSPAISKEIETLLPISDNYAEILIEIFFKSTKNKIKQYEFLKRSLIEERYSVSRARQKFEDSNAINVVNESLVQSERIKSKLNSMNASISGAKTEIKEVNEILAHIPSPIQYLKPIDLSNLAKPLVTFSENSITLSERQSENRTYHEIGVTNNLDTDLENLMIIVKSKEKCLYDFRLTKRESRSIRIPYEYELLAELGTFTCEIISCSFTMSNSVQISLIEISFREGCDKLIISNRFTTQKNCYLIINKVALKDKFTIANFDTLEMPLPKIEPGQMELFVFSEKNLLISNTIKK